MVTEGLDTDAGICEHRFNTFVKATYPQLDLDTRANNETYQYLQVINYYRAQAYHS